MSETDRFWSKAKLGAEDECWNWQRARNPQTGYGAFRVRVGKMEAAHRYAIKLSGVELTPKQFVLHKCDNKRCVNPRHLYVGTSRDNARDRLERRLQVRDEKGRYQAPCP